METPGERRSASLSLDDPFIRRALELLLDDDDSPEGEPSPAASDEEQTGNAAANDEGEGLGLGRPSRRLAIILLGERLYGLIDSKEIDRAVIGRLLKCLDAASGCSWLYAKKGRSRDKWDEEETLEMLSLVWNISAREPNKQNLVLEGCAGKVIGVLRKRFEKENTKKAACSAILQNICESRFKSGAHNRLQYKLVHEDGVLAPLVELAADDNNSASVRFRAAMALANLSMHRQNVPAMKESGAFAALRHFLGIRDEAEEKEDASPEPWRHNAAKSNPNKAVVFKKEPNNGSPGEGDPKARACGWDSIVNDTHTRDRLFGSWLSLMPFFPLLQAERRSVKVLALRCIEIFSRIPRLYLTHVWHDMALTGGVEPLKALARSPDELLRIPATNILKNLGVDCSDVKALVQESALAANMGDLFSSKTYCDVKIVVGSRQSAYGRRRKIYAHKAILCARSKVFEAMLSEKWAGKRNSRKSKAGEMGEPVDPVCKGKEKKCASSPKVEPATASAANDGDDDDGANAQCANNETNKKRKRSLFEAKLKKYKDKYLQQDEQKKGNAKKRKKKRIPHVLELGDDFSHEAMVLLMRYLYTDKADGLNWENSVEVMMTADVYGADRLKTICEDLLCQGIDETNVADLLDLADAHAARNLWNGCVEYVAANLSRLKASKDHKKWDMLGEASRESRSREEGADDEEHRMCEDVRRLSFDGPPSAHLWERLESELRARGALLPAKAGDDRAALSSSGTHDESGSSSSGSGSEYAHDSDPEREGEELLAEGLGLEGEIEGCYMS